MSAPPLGEEDCRLVFGLIQRLQTLNLAAEGAEPPAAKAKARAKRAAPKAAPRHAAPGRYYVVTAWRQHPDYCGIYHGSWATFTSEILGQPSLAGSGCSLRGFDSSDEAEEYWTEVHGTVCHITEIQ